MIENAATKKRFTYELSPPESADSTVGRISEKSPLAVSLIGRREGDEVVVWLGNGPEKYRIVRIERR